MAFIPHTDKDIKQMLDTLGVTNLQTLFDEIPAQLKGRDFAAITEGMSELEMLRLMQSRAKQDPMLENYVGAGAYEHHIPAAVWDIVGRGEFYSAYTPYQAEASQGTLQLLYEYQTMIASLTGMDVANASLYDGATALAEAVLMAVRANRKAKTKQVLVAGSLHPLYREALQTLIGHQGIRLIDLPIDPQSGITAIKQLPHEEGAAVVIAQPNFFGQLEAVNELTDWAHAQDMLVIGVVNPTALAVLSPPGQWGQKGADIACGEGQPLGVPLSAGGPYVGFMACRLAHVRQMPGRIIGRTEDLDGKPGFTLTLQAREQHIRRAKATSNICTNQTLLVIANTIYMALLGPEGLKRVALQSVANARRLVQNLYEAVGIELAYPLANSFHEVVLKLPCPAKALVSKMLKEGIFAGYDLGQFHSAWENHLLVCVTETKDMAAISRYVAAVERSLACIKTGCLEGVSC